MFSTPGSDIWPSPLRPIAALGRLSVEMVLGLGQFGRFFIQAAGYTVIPPFKFGRLVDRIHFIGFRSLTIVVLTGAFTGMVLGLQIFLTLSRFGSEAYLGPAVALSLIRELGPVLCAVFMTGHWKALSFGIIVPWVCTYKGFNCGHGAAGVARATTQAVVLSSVLILVWDYFLGSVLR